MEDGWESSVKNVSYLTQPFGPGILAVDSRTHSQTGELYVLGMSLLHHGLICVPSFYPLNTYTHLACPPDRYGEDCEHHCWCYGHSVCNQTTGKCVCQPGRKGFGCYQSEFTSQGNVTASWYCHYPLEESCTLCSSSLLCSSLLLYRMH